MEAIIYWGCVRQLNSAVLWIDGRSGFINDTPFTVDNAADVELGSVS